MMMPVIMGKQTCAGLTQTCHERNQALTRRMGIDVDFPKIDDRTEPRHPPSRRSVGGIAVTFFFVGDRTDTRR
jgi:hypothetical protein